MTLDLGTAPLLARSDKVELLDFDVLGGSDLGSDGPGPLLFLHGFDEDKEALKELGSHLCPPGAEAVYPTLRGHGASPRPAWGYSPWDVAIDIQRIGDRLPADLDVVGFSYGALIGLLAAFILGPERVRSVVVLDQSFERNDSYVELDQWLEASFLQWHFDHRHVIDAVAGLGIPILFVVAERSDVVGSAERGRLRARAGVECRSLDTDHRGLLADLDRLLPVLHSFYARVGRERGGSS